MLKSLKFILINVISAHLPDFLHRRELANLDVSWKSHIYLYIYILVCLNIAI